MGRRSRACPRPDSAGGRRCGSLRPARARPRPGPRPGRPGFVPRGVRSPPRPRALWKSGPSAPAPELAHGRREHRGGHGDRGCTRGEVDLPLADHDPSPPRRRVGENGPQPPAPAQVRVRPFESQGPRVPCGPEGLCGGTLSRTLSVSADEFLDLRRGRPVSDWGTDRSLSEVLRRKGETRVGFVGVRRGSQHQEFDEIAHNLREPPELFCLKITGRREGVSQTKPSSHHSGFVILKVVQGSTTTTETRPWFEPLGHLELCTTRETVQGWGMW